MEETPNIEFNAWLENVMKQLFQYSPGQQIIAATTIYTETYKKHEAEISKDKAILSQKEVIFNKLPFKVVE